MKTVDRILLSILVLLLPVGLLISYQLLSSPINKDELVIDAEKLKVMVENYSNMEINNEPKKEIIVSSVSYASKSGIISVSGNAPSSEASVYMSVTVLPPKPSPTPTVNTLAKNDQLILGRSVNTLSFETESDGSFLIDYEIESLTTIIELRLEQEETIKTIRFDLDKKEQIY